MGQAVSTNCTYVLKLKQPGALVFSHLSKILIPRPLLNKIKYILATCLN